MTDDIREQIALCRFKLISPMLAEPTRVQNEYFGAQAERWHDMPHYGRKRFSVSTFKHWLRHYRDQGFEGLRPKARTDADKCWHTCTQTVNQVTPCWAAAMRQRVSGNEQGFSWGILARSMSPQSS